MMHGKNTVIFLMKNDSIDITKGTNIVMVLVVCVYVLAIIADAAENNLDHGCSLIKQVGEVNASRY